MSSLVRGWPQVPFSRALIETSPNGVGEQIGSAVRSTNPSTSAQIELVRRAQRGEREAFAQLYNLRAAQIFRYTASLLHNPTAAEDATAETFLQAWKNRKSLKDPARFDAWLFRISHNIAMNELRRPTTSALDERHDSADADPQIQPDRALSGKGDAELMREALRALPDHYRDVLILRYYTELSSAEIGRQLGKSEQNVRVIQFRALKQLRVLVEAASAAPV